MCGDALQYVDGAITYNEPMPQGHDNPEHFPLFDHWQARVIRRLQDIHGLDALAFPFGTGQFTAAEDRVRLDVAFPESCAACRIISPHDYDWPNIWRSEGWRAMRWLAWLDDIEEAGHGRKEVIISEWGLTQATYGGPDIGWRSGVSQDDYMRQMDEYNARVCRMPEVKFFTPFNWGGIPFGWESFEHVPPDDFSVVDRIYTIVCPKQEEEKLKVYDFTHGLGSQIYHDMAWLRSYFGNVVIKQPDGLQAGDLFWKIVWLDCTVGPTSCIIHTDSAEGNPLQDITTVFHWSTAESFEDQGLPLLPHGWTENGAVGPTNINGDAGPSYGTGAYYDPAQGEEGPHSVWIYDPDRKSQYITGLGMLTMHPDVEGNHLKFNIGYKLSVYEDGEPPPPPPPPNGIVAELRTMGGRLLEIANHLEQADIVAESLKDDVNELADLL